MRMTSAYFFHSSENSFFDGVAGKKFVFCSTQRSAPTYAA